MLSHQRLQIGTPFLSQRQRTSNSNTNPSPQSESQALIWPPTNGRRTKPPQTPATRPCTSTHGTLRASRVEKPSRKLKHIDALLADNRKMFFLPRNYGKRETLPTDGLFHQLLARGFSSLPCFSSSLVDAQHPLSSGCSFANASAPPA